ncbi:MAG TPA: hypothetical protein VFA74_17905 [Terriglobales bacterium]|nr:hypothetical protein [Terriglobales bacterium]
MTLRSDFKIRALTPDTPSIAVEKEPLTSAVDSILIDPGTVHGQRAAEVDRDLFIDVDRIVRNLEHDDSVPHRRQVAFLVTHGMGQQVPFETLSMLGQSLITEHTKRSSASEAGVDSRADVRRVRLTSAPDAPELSRVEITFGSEKGDKLDLHLYESYWAPFTEGQISFLQTVAFLYSAGWNGIKTCISSARRRREAAQQVSTSDHTPRQKPKMHRNSLRHFDRWIFGDFHDMAIKRNTLLELIAIVVSVSLLLAPALLLFTPLGVSIGKWLFDGYANHYLKWPLVVQIGVALAAFLAMVLAWIIRYCVVEYVGDVAIYVSSYKVSRFDTIRSKILEEVCSVARQIYSAGISDETHPAYDSVVIVGHSLGSVISYDTLNSSINWDQVECGSKRKVVERTTRLITFGSPLDKTAFLFRTQVSSARNLREALAARQQPLILDYEKFRPLDRFRWINIHAAADIVSGHLDYYDLPHGHNVSGFNPVQNIVDHDARIPLLAHVEYWENPTLHHVLYEAAQVVVPVSQ